uniref:Taxadien-5-alpha-ol O-acetyltransferase n=2 Tax=Taxus TaxID=25628 RepID=T5AT_TAXCU
MEKTDLHVNLIEKVMVGPSPPLPKTTLQLSSIDNLPGVRGSIFNALLIYNASPSPTMISADPAKPIREALAKILVYYPPFAGRLRETENGDLEVECTGEGAMFLEAMADNELSVLGDFDDSNPSFQQLLFSLPLDTNFKDLSLLVVQVTRFTCGGFVVGVSFHHGVCDGRGAAQFLKGLAEMARGEVKLSLEPIWNRELVKLDDPKYLQFFHFEFLRAPSIVEKIVQTYFIIDFETINYIKQSVMEECKEFCSSFEVASAMTWIARTRAFQIPESEYVKILFGMDMRNSFNPPLPSGYYGNSIGTACAVDNVQDLLSGSLLRAIMIIKKSKVSLNDNFKSRAVVKPSELDVNMNHENVVAFADWSRLGFDEVDFGWGNAVSVSPVQQQSALAMQNYFLFLKPSKNKPDGIKILMFLPLSKMKSFKIEMEAMMKKYVAKV